MTGKKDKLLLLCHRVPYPPNKGDKIRAFHVVEFLSQHFDIYLGCLVDNQEDVDAYQGLIPYCKSISSVVLSRPRRYLKALLYLFINKPLSLAFFDHPGLKKWVRERHAAEKIDKVMLMSSSMYQYLQGLEFKTTIVDLIDVDSEKWRQYAEQSIGYKKYIYRREYKILSCYEEHIASSADQTFLVSEQEAQLLRVRLSQSVVDSVGFFANGVNCNYFSPALNSFLPSVDVIFVGNMDYLSNVISVQWFCRHVWPEVLKSSPRSTFYIVGANPDVKVLALSKIAGVTVTGKVEDVRPYLQNASVVVAPLLVGRGIQNKVLEAMAMAKPVVCTEQAATGIDTRNLSVYVTQQPKEMVEFVLRLLQQPFSALDNRLWAKNNLQWQHCLTPLLAAFDKETH